jgi:hypothetical protein
VTDALATLRGRVLGGSEQATVTFSDEDLEDYGSGDADLADGIAILTAADMQMLEYVAAIAHEDEVDHYFEDEDD